MRNIFLIGYMGAGKTTLGETVAERLGRQFVDMDQFIENRCQKNVAGIFAEKGEALFRELEHTLLQEIVELENSVISTGGGAPCFFNNMELMNGSGITVYLKVSVPELTKRLLIGQDKRPLIRDKTPDELERFVAAGLKRREAWYRQATLVFRETLEWTPENGKAMAEELVRAIRKAEMAVE